MCGRYLRRSDKQHITEYFRVHGIPPFPMPADYNVAPTTHQPVIRLNRDTGQRELVLMRWGLVPYYAKSLAEFKGISTINARAENMEGQLWKRLFQRHRCLIPADGFYEWKTTEEAPKPGSKAKPKLKKNPYLFSLRTDAPFALAGLWDAWLDPATNDWLQSFAIITTVANELMSEVHDRMPVILDPKDFDRWLDRAPDRPLPIDLLRPYDSEAMQAAAANPKVGNAANNGPEMMTPPPAEAPGEEEPPLFRNSA